MAWSPANKGDQMEGRQISHEKFLAVLREAEGLGVSGRFSGSSFRYHPHGVHRGPIMFVDEHHVDRHCTIRISSNPHSKWTPAGDHSFSDGCPLPKPVEGDLLTIWRNGSWQSPDGPWREAAIQMLEEIESELPGLRKRKAEREEAEKQKARETADRRIDDLRNSWSSSRSGTSL